MISVEKQEFKAAVDKSLSNAWRGVVIKPQSEGYGAIFGRLYRWGEKYLKANGSYPSLETIEQIATNLMRVCWGVTHCEVYHKAKVPYDQASDAIIDRLAKGNPSLSLKTAIALFQAEVKQINPRRTRIKKTYPKPGYVTQIKTEKDYEGW